MKWPAAILLGLSMLLSGCGGKGEAPKSPAVESDNKKDAGTDGTGVTIPKESQVRAGIGVETLAAQTVPSETIAYGHIEEDPSSAFEVRAPQAGILGEGREQSWPGVGDSIKDGSVLGTIQPRLAPSDQTALRTQLAAARAELSASAASMTAAQTAYDRARVLNADNKNVSDRVLQEAAAKLAAEQSRESAARALIQTLDTPIALASVVAGRGGEVVAVSAQPGEWVESGTPLMRLARFDHLFARVDLPVGEPVPAGAAAARIVPAGFEGQVSLNARRIAAVAPADTHAQGASLLYRLSGTLPGLRPGAAVSAHFTLPGSARKVVGIPPSAIVQQDGRPWVYVQIKDDRFARRPATPASLTAGERIVVTGAQTLLSEELKSQNEADSN